MKNTRTNVDVFWCAIAATTLILMGALTFIVATTPLAGMDVQQATLFVFWFCAACAAPSVIYFAIYNFKMRRESWARFLLFVSTLWIVPGFGSIAALLGAQPPLFLVAHPNLNVLTTFTVVTLIPFWLTAMSQKGWRQ